MKIPTRITVPADEVKVGDSLELKDEDGIRRATVKTIANLGDGRILFGTTEGPVQVETVHQVKITRTVEI